MTRDDELGIVRRVYAKQIVHAARAGDPRIEDALADLRREAFLPPGPWLLMRFPGGYQETPDNDPIYLYQDAPVAILPEKGLNNGQPSFLALLLSLGGLMEGESALHIGAGAGYYTALISRLAGGRGRVVGVELEPELAARARSNLARFSNVALIHGDGSAMAFEPADVVYVNAGASRPADVWLDALKPGGRMVLPLTTSFTTEDGREMTRGVVFLIERERDRSADHYAARCICSTAIYPCAGARDDASEAALAAALAGGGIGKVKRLYRTDDLPEARCWLRAPGWSLTYE